MVNSLLASLNIESAPLLPKTPANPASTARRRRRKQAKPVENDFGPDHQRRFGDSFVQADRQADYRGERREIQVKSAENEKEQDDFCDEIAQQERINPL